MFGLLMKRMEERRKRGQPSQNAGSNVVKCIPAYTKKLFKGITLLTSAIGPHGVPDKSAKTGTEKEIDS
jgi:hypothetical protein